MARPRGSTLVRGRTPRRQTSWGVGPGGTASQSLSFSTAVFIGSAIQPVTPGMTVVRIRGELLIHLTVATALGGYSGAVGIGIASAAAVAAGIASVPAPITESDDQNWMWHRFFQVRSAPILTPAADSNVGTEAVFRVEIDSKAMRKFDDGLNIYAALEAVEEGTSVIRFSLDTRVLLKLP